VGACSLGEKTRTLRQQKTIQKIRIGFLGTGYIADWHAQAIRKIPATSLNAVCDKNELRARAFAERYGVPRWYGSLEAMLQDVENHLDVVHVLLPPDLHASAASTLIEHGIHAFLEKPMATRASDCSELVEKAKVHNVMVGVNHNYLFAPIYEELREDLRSGRLGQPDHVTITWNRELDQLQSGPFNLWMLRDPRNIVLEIGPHCIAPILDLFGPVDIQGVRASNPVTLRPGLEFFRRWSVDAAGGPVAVAVNLSFSPGFTEQSIHVRGSLASATVDLERNTYLLHQHTRYGLDFDCFRMTTREAASLRSQAWRTFGRYGLSKLKLSTKGSPYGLSITRALESFYAGLGKTLDHRLSPELGRDATSLCLSIGQQGVGAQTTGEDNRPFPSVTPAPGNGASAEILILGATGFIGRELARQLLAAGHRIRVLVRSPGKLPDDLQVPSVDVVTGDLSRREDLLRAMDGSRVVYHLARANVKTWNEFVDQDIEVTRSVAEACLSLRADRLIYTGTIDSYYAGAKAGTITELTPLDPRITWRNLYARAKAASENILMAMHRERSLPVTIFRPGIVIGQGGSPFHWGIGMWSYNAVCQIWGDGRNPLPFVLVEDVAAALVTALDAPKIEGESFNLIAETDLNACDYLRALEDYGEISFQKFPTPPWKFYAADLAKWTVKQLVRHPDQRRPSYRDWETRTQKARYDCTKARNLLNWTPVCDRAELIRRGIQIPASEILPRPGGFKTSCQAAIVDPA
jgi:predicted dehydrogenase/nucleoside-diphosphate-sugar epimerase